MGSSGTQPLKLKTIWFEISEHFYVCILHCTYISPFTALALGPPKLINVDNIQAKTSKY